MENKVKTTTEEKKEGLHEPLAHQTND